MVPHVPPFVKCPLPDVNYGFVVMPWKTSLVWGLTMLGLFVVQVVAKLRSHPENSRQEAGVSRSSPSSKISSKAKAQMTNKAQMSKFKRHAAGLGAGYPEIIGDSVEIRRRYGRDTAEMSG
jgi:hypothetical protein